MRRVIILQGVSGSGKTTYARKLCRDFEDDVPVIVSADHYFTDPEGRYRFNPSKLDQAHGQCFRRFIEAMQLGSASLIIVDNTNAKVSDIAPYMQGAVAYGYSAEIHRMICPPDVAAARNIHNVPAAKVVHMAGRIARAEIPPFWKLIEVRP